MRVLMEQDFDKLANRVVDQFLEGKTKLADAAAEEALQAGLNPDQIERLVQSANTQTFLRMMDQRKKDGASDLMHEFDPIDSRQVIRIVIDRTGVHIDGPHDHSSNDAEGSVSAPEQDTLPDEMSAMRESEAPEEKSDEKPKDKKPEKNEKKEQKEAVYRIHRMRKLAGILEDEYCQQELTFEEKFNQLACRFKRAHVELPFEAFEKDALAEATDSTNLGILNALRESRGLTPLSFESASEKTAALADRHVVEDSEELHLYEELVKTAREADKIRRGLSWIKTQCA